jgi:L-fucose isomerase-like protein
MNSRAKPVVAILTFTDAREEGISSQEVERLLRNKQGELAAFLREGGIEVIDPLASLRARDSPWYGLRSLREIDQVVRQLLGQEVDAVVVGAWTWSPPMFIKEFLRKFPKPLAYYTENDPMSGNLSQLTATCSSLMDWSVNLYARRHERCFGNRPELARWARGAAACSRMREAALLEWGGSYAVKMDQLQDDFTKLKSFLIRDVLLEDQYLLVSRAERIRQREPARLRAFLDWVRARGLTVTYDPRMVTDEALAKQTALLLAARDRLAELEEENIRGVSIKCQHEIYSEYGVNACMLPAFLPFGENELGPQRIWPTVCEGDTKGLLTAVLLHELNPGVPPAFGDLVSVGDDHIEFANCGAGSLFWAANSLEAGQAFPRVEALANIHGNSGAAFAYSGVEAPAVTVARLTRIDGVYYMQLGAGRELDARAFLERKLGERERSHLGGTWGKVVVDLGVKGENFVKVIGANHLHATLGDLTAEIQAACRLWGIRTVRLDSDEDMLRFYDEVRR